MNISDKSVSPVGGGHPTHRNASAPPPGQAGATAQDKSATAAVGKSDSVSLSPEIREAQQTKPGALPPDQKVVAVQPGQPTDLAKTSGAQSPSQKWNAAEAGPDQSRALYNREGASGQVSRDVQAVAGTAALTSTPKPGQLSAPQKVSPTNPQSQTKMSQHRPSEGISRSEFLKNLKSTFSLAANP